ncbi:hypothetical protein CCACVL1_18069 [Corchorus capsularis]|uniref:Uncharacterized protein n=1 Tax=Corchorus capsularis TaxID=210143 RepID=A0A1R3HNG2_COCAP|nr:hypothetical protein CCACVL1_18069 [Corchorus capsularis]
MEEERLTFSKFVLFVMDAPLKKQFWKQNFLLSKNSGSKQKVAVYGRSSEEARQVKK